MRLAPKKRKKATATGCKLSVAIFPAIKAPPQMVVVKKEEHRFLSCLFSLKVLPLYKISVIMNFTNIWS